MVASRCPQRFLPAALISFSTSVLGQVFAGADLGIRSPSWRDCPIYSGWGNNSEARFHWVFVLVGGDYLNNAPFTDSCRGTGWTGLAPALSWTWTGWPTRRIRIGPQPSRRRIRIGLRRRASRIPRLSPTLKSIGPGRWRQTAQKSNNHKELGYFWIQRPRAAGLMPSSAAIGLRISIGPLDLCPVHHYGLSVDRIGHDRRIVRMTWMRD